MKKGKFVFLASFLIFLICTGCQHYYSRFVITDDMYNQLEIKKTKTDQIVKLLGEPYKISFVGAGNEIWTYVSGYDKTRKDPDFKPNQIDYVRLYYLIIENDLLVKIRNTRFRPLRIFLKELKYDDSDNDFSTFHRKQADDALQNHLRIHQMHLDLHNSQLK